MLYIIGNKTLSLCVESFGAQPVSIKKGGEEKLWQHNVGLWQESAPLLFPYAGNVKVLVDGKKYPYVFHGIAKSSEFSLVSQTSSTLTLSLKSNAETKVFYPFDFELLVSYSVRNTTVFIKYTVINPSVDRTLYFSCGGHESFNIKGRLEDYYVKLEKSEPLMRVYHNGGGTLSGKQKVYPATDIIDFNVFKIKNSETLIFKNIKSESATLFNKNGEKVCESYFKGFKNLLFWRAGNLKYICIEPWKNLPDIEGNEYIEFKNKQGVEKVLPQSEKTVKRKIVY